MVKSLITGPGFVASHLADLLLEKGEEVYVTKRWTDDQQSFEHIDKVNWIPMDLNDLSSCIKAIEKVKPDYIYHLGAQSYVNESFDYPAVTLQTNIIGTFNLLEAIRMVRDNYGYGDDCRNGGWECCIHGVKFDPVIHVCSSSEVYGQVDEKDIPIKETQAFNPLNPYAVSKVGEDMVGLLYFSNYGLKVIRTRFFTHTGPRRVMLSAEVNFAKQIAEFEKDFTKDVSMNISIGQQYILKHGNLNSIRTFADVRDAVKGYWLLSRKGVLGKVYNIGGNTAKSIGDMLDYLISLSPIKDRIKKELDPKLLRPKDVTLQIPDTSEFKKDTGWEPEIPFEKTMQDVLNFWRAKCNRQV